MNDQEHVPAQAQLADLTARLERLRQQLELKRRLESELKSAQRRLDYEQSHLAALEAELSGAQNRCQALEGWSLLHLVHALLNDRDERLRQAQQQLRSAQMRLGPCRMAIAALQDDQIEIHNQLLSLRGIERQYKELLVSKEEILLQCRGGQADELHELHEALRLARFKLRRLEQARQAGRAALAGLDRAMEGYRPAGEVWSRMRQIEPLLQRFIQELDHLALAPKEIRAEIGRLHETLRLLPESQTARNAQPGNLECLTRLYQQVEVILGALAANQVSEQSALLKLEEEKQRLVESLG